MPEEDSPEIRNKVVRLILELLCLQGGAAHEYALMQFCDWHRHHEVWKGSIEEALRDLVSCIRHAGALLDVFSPLDCACRLAHYIAFGPICHISITR